MMRKNLLVLILLSAVVFTGCSNANFTIRTVIEQIQNKEQAERLHYYDSPYTLCYSNKDGTYSFYIFASPVQYKTKSGYEMIDNTVVESAYENYVFENKASDIKTYFPSKISEGIFIASESEYMSIIPDFEMDGFSDAETKIITNMYGDKVSGVVYKNKEMDLYFYPTLAGTKMEILWNTKPKSNILKFMLHTSATHYSSNGNGYILFKSGAQNSSVVYMPLIKDSGNNTNIVRDVNIEGEWENYEISIPLDKEALSDENAKYPVHMDLSFDLYRNKLPDSTVYSQSDINNYLANYAVIGEHPVLGEGWHYTRARIQYFINLTKDSILSAHFSIRDLSGNPPGFSIAMEKVGKQWSSTGILWDSKADSLGILSKAQSDKNHTFVFDMTDFVRESLEDTTLETESIGVVLKSEEQNKNTIIATSDNSLYPPYLCIKTSDAPGYFHPKDNINETQY